MIFPYAEKGDRFQRNGKGAKSASATSRAASNGRRRLCGNDLYAMKLPFSHSPSVIKPSQAMRTARHHHGGRCDSYGNRCAACSSGMSVNIKSKSKQRESRVDHTFLSQDKSTLSTRLILFYLGRSIRLWNRKNCSLFIR
jgi:hypothetical protein